jgi:hypothetical protein
MHKILVFVWQLTTFAYKNIIRKNLSTFLWGGPMKRHLCNPLVIMHVKKKEKEKKEHNIKVTTFSKRAILISRNSTHCSPVNMLSFFFGKFEIIFNLSTLLTHIFKVTTL